MYRDYVHVRYEYEDFLVKGDRQFEKSMEEFDFSNGGVMKQRVELSAEMEERITQKVIKEVRIGWGITSIVEIEATIKEVFKELREMV